MASGSAGRGNNQGGKGFDFGTDDILCSYEDYGHQDGSNGSGHSEPVIGSISAKEFHKNRMARTAPFPSASYSPPEESSFNQDLVSTVEKTVKKHSDNLMRFLEGISSRLSQLELYCYNLDKAIGEMRSELVHDHGEADSKLKSLEKHVQEVHRSVQILRDKQELAETQKELAELHLVQKESSSATSFQQDRSPVAATDIKTSDASSDNQLALALPNQVLPQAPVSSRPGEQHQSPIALAPSRPVQSMAQSQGYYLTQAQPPNVPSSAQPSQGQYLPADSQFRAPQMQDLTRVPPQTAQSQVNQSPQVQLLSPYQPQWTQQLPQQVQQAQQPTMQPQMRPSSSPVYSSYMPNQANPTPGGVPNSMPMQLQFSSQSGGTHPESVPYGYGASGRPVQQQPLTQHLKPTYASAGDGYAAPGSHPTLTPGNAYVIYEEGGRGGHHPAPPHFSQSGYPPNMPSQNLQLLRPPPSFRNSPYGELIEKLLSMGYRAEYVVSAIQRLEESGQPVDFNAVLDRLNGHPSGGSQRGCSG